MYLGCLSSDETVVQWRFDTLISISVSVFVCLGQESQYT